MAKVALILEGGGMRGAFTAGALDCFLDEGLLFEDVVGVSAGACNAMSYLSGQRGRTLDVNVTFCRDRRYVSWHNYFTTGSVFGMDFLFGEISEKLIPFDYEAFNASGSRMIAVATNCVTGAAEYLPVKDSPADLVAVKASSSLPIFSNIVPIGGIPYLDGGVADSIPVQYGLDQGFDKLVVVLTRDSAYRKKPYPLRRVYAREYSAYPWLIEAMDNRHVMYNSEVERVFELEREGKALVIRPGVPVEISRFEKNPQRIRDLYQIGYDSAASLTEQVKSFCAGAENLRPIR